VDSGDTVIVGVNRYQENETTSSDLLTIDPDLVRRQRDRTRQYKSDRNGSAVHSALNQLKTLAESQENVIPGIIAAVKAKCTLGEISDVFREIFGEFHPG